jgi:Ca-activated chloride channel family protein
VWWTNPLWLLGLMFIVPILWLGGFIFRPQKVTANPALANSAFPEKLPAKGSSILRRLTILRMVAVIAVVLALAGTSILVPTHNRQLVIIMDISASISQTQIEKSRTTALRIIQKLTPADRVAIVTFATQPNVLIPLTAASDAALVLESATLSVDHPEQSNLQAALRIGAELLNKSRGNRAILLFSDGRSTNGGFFSDALAQVGIRSIPVYTVPVGQPWSGLVARGLELPEIIHPHENIQLLWKVETNRRQDILVSLKCDDQTVKQGKMIIQPGQTSIPLTLTAPAAGIHRVEVEAATVSGEYVAQSRWEGLFQVNGPSQVLIISGNLSNSALSSALRTQGMQVTEQSINNLPDSMEWLSSYSAVILDNVPALYLSENQQKLLQKYVTNGGGLLVIGGDSSLGRGDYYATGLEEMLPVQTDTRQRLMFSRANILFVIDHSGSMSEMVGKTSKQLAAMQGVATAVKELNPQDEVGILSFDTEPSWVIHFTPVSRKTEIMKALSEIGEGGGTNMEAAIKEVVRSFSNTGPVRRHVVILTDGQTGSENIKKLVVKLKELGVSVTTIGVGEEINESLLRDVARWGDGQFYRADLDKIPQVIQKETIRITRDLIQEGFFQPVLKTKAAFLGGLEKGLLPVKGYLITKPKNLATVYLQVGKQDPLIAVWRYGNGRVAVFTSDSGERWLTLWSGSRSYNLLWSQMVRFIERSKSNQGLRVSTRVESATAQIIVEATGTDHRFKTGMQLTGYPANHPDESFDFKEIAPGRYQAYISLSQPGIEQFEIREGRGMEWALGWVWNPPRSESLELGPDLARLGQLSNSTGGKMLSLNRLTLPSRRLVWEPVHLKNWFIVLALLLLLAELAYRSLALGQISMVRAVFESWWAAQMRIIEMVRGTQKVENNIEEQYTTMAAYRYMAESARKHKREVSKDA